jgi:hypothetical protein
MNPQKYWVYIVGSLTGTLMTNVELSLAIHGDHR